MSLTENFFLLFTKEELKHVEKTGFANQDVQSKILFDLLLKYPNEPEKINIRFKKLVPKGNISVVGVQLNKIILKALYHLKSAENVSAVIHENILLIDTFAKKGHQELTQKLLDKSIKMAEENELFSALIELTEIQLNFYRARFFTDVEGKEKVISRLTLFQQLKGNQLDFALLLFQQMELLNQNFVIKSEELLQKHEQIMQHPLMVSEQNARSTKAKIDYWTIRAQYFSTCNQIDKTVESTEFLLNVFLQNEQIKKQKNLLFLSLCGQLITYAHMLQNPSIIKKAIAFIQESKKYNELEEIAASTFLANATIIYSDLTHDQTELLKSIQGIELLLQQYGEKIKEDSRMGLILASMSGYAEVGEYDKLLKFANKFRPFIHSSKRIDATVAIQFYELIAQIETGNEILVNDTLQNFNRFLLRHEFKGAFEAIMIRFLKIVSSHSIHEKKEILKLKNELQGLPEKSLQNQNSVLYPILLNMVESKLNNQKFHEFMQSKK